ncbi:MAG TPA: VOC family protein [Actinoplanes sp.]|nr:VOC family protein [Actinoplanes sp.]
MSFDLGGGAGLSLWSGQFDGLTPGVPRTSEVCLALPGGSDAAIDRQYERWVAKGVRVVSEPRTESFGRTFVVGDPDGNLIRVALID